MGQGLTRCPPIERVTLDNSGRLVVERSIATHHVSKTIIRSCASPLNLNPRTAPQLNRLTLIDLPGRSVPRALKYSQWHDALSGGTLGCCLKQRGIAVALHRHPSLAIGSPMRDARAKPCRPEGQKVWREGRV